MELLHFHWFVQNEDDKQEIISYLENELQLLNDKKSVSNWVLSKELLEIYERYENFSQKTRNGEHGLTAQYWFMYIELIQHYHVMCRSVRTGDFELYRHCLPKLTAFFFALNHPNYARWLVKYHSNLLQIETTHPELYKDFRNGWFSLARTRKSFAQQPVDIVLEQTINADGASQKTGITAFTNNILARQRWAETHYSRTMIISEMLEGIALNKKEDVTEEIKSHRIRSNQQALNKVKTEILANFDPFSNSNINKDVLVNIGTGKAASEETTKCLLNTVTDGEVRMEQFIKDCSERTARFSERISRRKLHTFSNDGLKVQIRQKDKIIAVQMTRDLLGCILRLSLEKKVDMGEVLKYLLIPFQYHSDM